MIVYGVYRYGDEYGFVDGVLYLTKKECYAEMRKRALEWNQEVKAIRKGLSDEDSIMPNFITRMKKLPDGNYGNGTDGVKLEIFKIETTK